MHPNSNISSPTESSLSYRYNYEWYSARLIFKIKILSLYWNALTTIAKFHHQTQNEDKQLHFRIPILCNYFVISSMLAEDLPDGAFQLVMDKLNCFRDLEVQPYSAHSSRITLMLNTI